MALDIRQILRDKPGSFLGYFLPLLILAEDNEKLLDVVDLFGFDRLEECIERLGGSKIEFPTWATVDALVSDAYLLYLLDKKTSQQEIEKLFDAPYSSLLARAQALRGSLKMEEKEFPGRKPAAKWNRRMRMIRKQIAEEAAK